MKSNNNTPNLIFAVILIIGFMFAWEGLITSKYRPQQTTTPNTTSAQTPAAVEKDSNDTPPQKVSSVVKDNIPQVERVIESDNFKIIADGKGGRITSWSVKESGQWVELISRRDGLEYYPLETFSDLNFDIQVKDDKNIIFSAEHPHGINIVKTISLDKEPPFHEVELSFQNINNRATAVDTEIGWGEGLFKTYLTDDEEEIEEKEKLAEAETKAVGYAQKLKSWRGGFFTKEKNSLEPGPYHWAGVDNDHFLAAFVFGDRLVPDVRVSFKKKHSPSLLIPIEMSLSPGETKKEQFKLFVGPKKYSELKEVGYHLDQSLDFGFISRFLVFMLEFFHKYTQNYGWAIIFLTLFIQVLMYPLTRKSLQSSLKMKAVQPQVAKIREQFKNDPKRQQIEMFNIYRKNGLKFMGMEGCLPILIQMPIFFAIFKVLRVAYELRGAEWLLWVKDLSAPDPLYILPVVMGLMMFIQQKLTSVAADPTQARMMYFFPIMMTVVFINMPSGLIIYWTVQSIATIFVHKLIKPAKA